MAYKSWMEITKIKGVLMENLLRIWIENSQEIIVREGYVSIHLDQLLEQHFEKDKILGVSINIFSQLVKYVILKDIKFIPLLTIPLHNGGNKITFSVPRKVEDILRDLGDEPPSLYLLEKQTDLGFDGCEEYRKPLSFDIVTRSVKGKTYSYYREYRDRQAIKSQWEFNRCLYTILIQK